MPETPFAVTCSILQPHAPLIAARSWADRYRQQEEIRSAARESTTDSPIRSRMRLETVSL